MVEIALFSAHIGSADRAPLTIFDRDVGPHRDVSMLGSFTHGVRCTQTF
jgi:hypothetical protein